MPHQLYYNNKKKYLAIKHQSVNYDSAWDSLFMHFAQSVATIISEKYGQVVARLSTGGLDAISYNIDSLPATEEMTDMLFALGDYESATDHRFRVSRYAHEKFRPSCPRNLFASRDYY